MRLDFWNEPTRWDGVDPNKECFWMRRRRDIVDVRKSTPPNDPRLEFLVGAGNSQSQLAKIAQHGAFNQYQQDQRGYMSNPYGNLLTGNLLR